MRIDVLLCLVCFACLVTFIDLPAQELYGGYHYRTQVEDGAGFQQNQSTHYPPSTIDYAETPSGLPPGVYRPVEQRHTIIPHKDGFRFRTLTPQEQQRIKRRNEYYNQSWQSKQPEKRFSPSSDGYGYSEPLRQGGYKFRPDKRLDNTRGGNWQRSHGFPYNPAFTEAYQTPMLRPE